MTIQNPNDKLNVNPNQFDVDSSRVESSKNKPALTKESVARTNKKVGSIQSKIIEANNQGGSLAEKQKNLEKLEAKVLKAQSFFNQVDAELKALSTRKDKLNLVLGDIHESGGSSAELYREELKSVTNQIQEYQQLSADFGGGLKLVTSSLQQVQASLAELKNIERSITELSRQYPVLRDLSDENKQQLLTIPNESMTLLMPRIRNMLNREMDQSDMVKIVFGMHIVMEAVLRDNKNLATFEGIVQNLKYRAGTSSELAKPQIADILMYALKIATPETPGEDIVEVIKELLKIPVNEREDVVNFAMELFPKETIGIDEVGEQDLIIFINEIPYKDRAEIVDIAKELFTENMNLKVRLECLRLLSDNPDDRDEIFEFLTELRNIDGFSLLGAFEDIPAAEMQEVLDDAIELATNMTTGDVKTSDVYEYVKILGKIDPEERGEIIQFANGLITEDMTANDKAVLIEVLNDIPSSQERYYIIGYAESLSSDVEEWAHFVVALANIPQKSRDNVVKQAQKLFTEDMSTSDKVYIIENLANMSKFQRKDLTDHAFNIIAHGYDVTLVSILLQNQAFREAIITKCQTELQDADYTDFSSKSISNFVYDHRTDLKLDEDHPLWQLAFLQMQQAYLESPNKILKSGIELSYLDSKGLVGTDSKIDALSKVQFEKLKKLKSEMANIEKTKTKDLGLGEEIESTELRSADVSEEEARLFQEELGTFKSPGKIGKFFISDHYKPPVLLKDKKLENGMIISVPFHLAMNFYTTAHYRLMNGTLDNDQKNIDLWKRESQKAGKNVTDDFVRESQEHVIQIARVAVAGMNKLPPYEGLLYRGASITPAKLEELRQGAVILTKKFLSCSTNVNVCETFAKRSTKENIEKMQSEYKPVLYVYKSENAKDIREFSNYKHEDERVYTPGQGFRSVKVDEKTIPGLAIIYMQEMN